MDFSPGYRLVSVIITAFCVFKMVTTQLYLYPPQSNLFLYMVSELSWMLSFCRVFKKLRNYEIIGFTAEIKVFLFTVMSHFYIKHLIGKQF